MLFLLSLQPHLKWHNLSIHCWCWLTDNRRVLLSFQSSLLWTDTYIDVSEDADTWKIQLTYQSETPVQIHWFTFLETDGWRSYIQNRIPTWDTAVAREWDLLKRKQISFSHFDEPHPNWQQLKTWVIPVQYNEDRNKPWKSVTRNHQSYVLLFSFSTHQASKDIFEIFPIYSILNKMTSLFQYFNCETSPQVFLASIKPQELSTKTPWPAL